MKDVKRSCNGKGYCIKLKHWKSCDRNMWNIYISFDAWSEMVKKVAAEEKLLKDMGYHFDYMQTSIFDSIPFNGGVTYQDTDIDGNFIIGCDYSHSFNNCDHITDHTHFNDDFDAVKKAVIEIEGLIK